MLISRAEGTIGVKWGELFCGSRFGEIVRAVFPFPSDYHPFKCNWVFPQLRHIDLTRRELLAGFLIKGEKMFPSSPIMQSTIAQIRINLAQTKMATVFADIFCQIHFLVHSDRSFQSFINCFLLYIIFSTIRQKKMDQKLVEFIYAY